MLEAIAGLRADRRARRSTGRTPTTSRIGDHIWYVSDVRKFRTHYPSWKQRYSLDGLLRDIYERNIDGWTANPAGASA